MAELLAKSGAYIRSLYSHGRTSYYTKDLIMYTKEVPDKRLDCTSLHKAVVEGMISCSKSSLNFLLIQT